MVPATKVRMKPGKPLTFATISSGASRSSSGQLVVFGLPGNPVSSIVTFNLVVLPALRAMAGWAVIPFVRALQSYSLSPKFMWNN